MEGMFKNCENLNNLDLSSFNISFMCNPEGIFHGCKRDIIDSNLYKFKKYDREYLTSFKKRKEYKNCIII